MKRSMLWIPLGLLGQIMYSERHIRRVAGRRPAKGLAVYAGTHVLEHKLHHKMQQSRLRTGRRGAGPILLSVLARINP
jgi:hypothetical protein